MRGVVVGPLPIPELRLKMLVCLFGLSDSGTIHRYSLGTFWFQRISVFGHALFLERRQKESGLGWAEVEVADMFRLTYYFPTYEVGLGCLNCLDIWARFAEVHWSGVFVSEHMKI